jgi:hypothetical protein
MVGAGAGPGQVSRSLLLLVAAVLVTVTSVKPVLVRAQSDEARPGRTLDTLESLMGWPLPDPDARTDVRVLTRSVLGIVPLPLVRLIGGDNDQVVATVTEWGEPNVRPDGHPLFFKYLPLECSHDDTVCAGTPRVIKTPEVKALWFALFIARSCNDHPRKTPTDAEELFVRGRAAGMSMEFSCRTPNPRGPNPGDREAASILRISHRLLGR